MNDRLPADHWIAKEIRNGRKEAELPNVRSRKRRTGEWVVLSYGLGVDSTAILLRWLTDPTSRDFDLDDLVVITAQVGSEYPETIKLVNEHVFRLLRSAGVRTVEIAKAGPKVEDGYKTLQDTREPVALHPDGVYRLIDELRTTGTIPQYGGIRKCSLKFKGEPIDRWLDTNLPIDSRFVHVMGYESEEGPWLGEGPAPKGWTKPGKSRAEKDARSGAKNRKLGHRRTPNYPLVEWDWNRARCLEFIKEVTGADWAKSACTFCPFAEDRGLGRLGCDEAVTTMKLEAVAVALNPRQTLFPEIKGVRGKHKGHPMPGSAIETFEIHFPEAYEAYVEDICSGDWTCYEVKRAWKGVGANGKAQSGGANGRRISRPLAKGTAAACHKVLRERAQLHGIKVATDEFGFRMADVAPKPAFGNGIEHRFVVAPAGALDKEGDQYASLAAQAEAA